MSYFKRVLIAFFSQIVMCASKLLRAVGYKSSTTQTVSTNENWINTFPSVLFFLQSLGCEEILYCFLVSSTVVHMTEISTCQYRLGFFGDCLISIQKKNNHTHRQSFVRKQNTIQSLISDKGISKILDLQHFFQFQHLTSNIYL